MKDYIFELVEKKDLEDIFTLYAERIRWMDAHGIKQWNVCQYLELYPLSYYREQYEHGNLYSLDTPETICRSGLSFSGRAMNDGRTKPAFRHIISTISLPAPASKGREYVSSQKQRGLPLNMANVSFVWIAPSIMRL